MLYLDFQRGKVPHNFHVCAAFFKIVRECRNAALWIHHCTWSYHHVILTFYLCVPLVVMLFLSTKPVTGDLPSSSATKSVLTRQMVFE